MRKVWILFSISLVLLATIFILFLQYRDKDIDEKTYCIKSNYVFLSDGEVALDVKLYTNDENSLLQYANESDAAIHDKSEENYLSVDISNVCNFANTYYRDELFYEYNVTIKAKINEFKVDDCYLTLNYDNKTYLFNIGSVEIRENVYEKNPYKIVNLYGVSGRNDLTLKGIIISIKNDSLKTLKLTKVDIGTNSLVILNDNNNVEVSESSKIDDYEYTTDSSLIVIESGETKTVILPINYKMNNQLTNCYLLLEINGNTYYVSNFNFINTNDLESMKNYLSLGYIYES